MEAVFEKDIILSGIWNFNVHEKAAMDECKIIGEKGLISFPFFGQPILKIHTDKINEVIEFKNPKHVEQPMIEKVVQFFRGEEPNPCSLEDSLMSMKMMDKTIPAFTA